MNKFFAIVILIWFSGFGLMGFDNTEQTKFLDQFNSINKNGMYVLGSWAVLNIVSGTIGNFSATGKTKYFHQMNAVWNSVNLGIAVFSLMNSTENNLTLLDSFKEYNNLQNFLLLNTGLDAAYIVTGFFLKEKSYNSKTKGELLYGYGNSLIIQGAFLLAFDLILYFFHQSNAEINLYPLINNIDKSYLGIQFQLNL